MARPAAIPAQPARAAVLGDVPHGFFGSGAACCDDAALQFGYGGEGDEADIANARQAAAQLIAPDSALVAPHQVHSRDVITVDFPWPDTAEGRPQADALVTASAGITLGIVTADCAPVLLCDHQAGVIGAAHAGWRGAHGGVLENTVAAMQALGADSARIAAAIGPTIAQPSYEVDDGFKANFTAEDEAFFAPGSPDRPGHWQFDLPGYVASRLRVCGVTRIEDIGHDTYALESHYYSYRRATHRGEASYGRQMSMIALA